MGDYYILDGKKAVETDDTLMWAKWFDANRKKKKVAYDRIGPPGGEIGVSTVFLGLDHSYGDGPPLLFETMVFGGELDQEQDRYTTWEQAEEGHTAMVERVKATIQ